MNPSSSPPQYNYSPWVSETIPTLSVQLQTQIAQLLDIQQQPSIENNSEAKGSKRTRISRACDTCRKKKIKCNVDNQQPCTTCKQYDWECTFNDSTRKRGPPKGYIESLEARLKRMEEILGKIQTNSDDEDTLPHKINTNRSENHHKNVGSPQVSTIQSISSEPNSPQSSIDNESTHSEPNKGSKAKIVRFLGSSSGLYLVDDMLKQKDKYENNNHNEHSPVGSPSSSSSSLHLSNSENGSRVPHHQQQSHNEYGSSTSTDAERKDYNTDYTSLPFQHGTVKFKRMNIYNDDLVMVRDETDDEHKNRAGPDELESIYSTIPRLILTSLIHIYFEAPCATLPILEKEEFMNSYMGTTHPSPDPLLIYAICSYACYMVPSSHPMFKSAGLERNTVFHALVDRAGLLIRNEYLTPRIQTIQALILLCAHPTYSSGSYRNWLLAGMAVRMAQDLGLHRSLTTANVPPEKLEHRRRLWYSVYLTDRWCCSAMGRPLAIADSDCDTDFPNVNGVNEPGKYTMFVYLVKLSGILGEVLRRVYSPKAKSMGYTTHFMEQTVWSLDKMLKDWFESVPPEYKVTKKQLFEMKGMEYTRLDLFRSGGPLTICYYAIIVLLFRPFIVFENTNNQQSNRLFKEASIRCMEAAKSAIDVARYVPGTEMIRYGWNFAAYAVFQAALIHVYNCTSTDATVTQTSRDYIRICINDCLAPLTTDIPHAPPVIQFLENLLRLMKADVSVLKTSNDKSTHSNNDHVKASSSSSSSSLKTTTTNNNNLINQHSASNTSLPSISSSSKYHTKTSAALQNETSLPYIPSIPNSTPSPMSVYQIVSGMSQPNPSPLPTTSSSTTTLQGSPSTINSDHITNSSNINNNHSNMNNNMNNPINLINLALTDNPLLNNDQENPMMTQAAWQYLFSSAGTPFINNTNNRNNANPQGWDSMFNMEGDINQLFFQ
ncbi:unnamed protein product [Cunninghamella blakesleeana]